MNVLAEEFNNRLAAVEIRINRLSEEQWSQHYGRDSWLRKEVLGHLVDSAANNHLRFVMAALGGRFSGPGYDQNGWVRIHDYANMPAAAILSHWRSQNSQLAGVVKNLTASQLQAMCKVADDPEMTLREVIVSYLDHMEHHVEQIVQDL